MLMILQRQPSADGATIGELSIEGQHECWTLEDVVRLTRAPDGSVVGTKIPGKTAIPAGRYRVVIDWSNRFQRMMPHILDVEQFDGIRMHAGNTAEDTDGCPLVGVTKGANTIGQSRMAFEPLFAKIVAATQDGGECWIEVRDA